MTGTMGKVVEEVCGEVRGVGRVVAQQSGSGGGGGIGMIARGKT